MTAKPDPIVLQTLYYGLVPGLFKEKRTTLAAITALGLVGALALSRVEVTRSTRLFVGIAPAPLYFAWAFHRASRQERARQENVLDYNQRKGSAEFKQAVDRALGLTKDDRLLQIARLRLVGGRSQEFLNERAKSVPQLKGIDAQAILDNHPLSGETLSADYVQGLLAEKGWTKALSGPVDPGVAVRAILLLNRFKESLPVLEYHFSDDGRTAELLAMQEAEFRPAFELLRGGEAKGDKIDLAQRRAAIEDGLFSHITRKIGSDEPKGFDDSKELLTLESEVRRALFVSVWERVGEKGKRKIAEKVRFLSSSPEQKFGERVNPLLLPSEITPLLSGYSFQPPVDCTLFFRMKGWEMKFYIAGSEQGLFPAALAGLIIDSEGVENLRSNLRAQSDLRLYANAVRIRLVHNYGMQFESDDRSVFNALDLLKRR